MHHPTDRIAHTMAFVRSSHGALAGTRNSSMGPPHEGSIRRPALAGMKNSSMGFMRELSDDLFHHDQMLRLAAHP